MKEQLPKSPQSYWQETVTFPEFPKLKESIKVDVAIAGGGITGITAAYLLTKQNIKVALIDSDKILNGTTGHTTAKITAQHGLIYDEFINHFGLEITELYYNAQLEARKLIETTIDELNIKCGFQKEDAYIYTNSNEYVAKLEKEMKAYEKLKIEGDLTDQMPLELPVKSVLRMKNQAQFHPLSYLNKLAEEAVANGASFYENTVALDIEYNKDPAIITDDGHRITSKYVISATHFPFYDLTNSSYFARLYPERAYVVAGETEKKFPGGMYINAEQPVRSIRTTPIKGKNLWLIGGENHRTGEGESTITHYEALQQFAKTHFDIDPIQYRWSAQDLTTLDKMPYIGNITKAQDTVFVATGYRKWGMTNGTIAAKMLTDMILQKNTPYEEVFTPSRFKADPSVKKLIQTNAGTAKQMVKGKFELPKRKIEDLHQDDATITRVDGKRTGVYRDDNGQIHAVDTTCTHMGCEVSWNSGDRTWDCPCHGSRYSYSGEVIEGPAKKPLKRLEINIE
jgi:glycine/D-amino acid oxidase-like deaminating enzyme/nitrite reductase/ring-hydroxylating ferredoxin subunit